MLGFVQDPTPPSASGPLFGSNKTRKEEVVETVLVGINGALSAILNRNGTGTAAQSSPTQYPTQSPGGYDYGQQTQGGSSDGGSSVWPVLLLASGAFALYKLVS